MVDNPSPPNDTLAVILAGGSSTRMGGGDKSLVEIGGAPLLSHILARLRPQTAAVVLNANGDPARFTGYGLDVIADEDPLQGPLAGVIAGLAHAERNGFAFCLTVPGDAPLLPRDLTARLRTALDDRHAPCAVAQSGGRRQNVFALWRTSALSELRTIYAGGTRALWRAQDALGAIDLPFADDEAMGFSGLNRPEDRTVLAALVRTDV